MKKTFRGALAVLLLAALNHSFSTAHSQGTAYTYQGRLNKNDNAADGSYDLAFTLFNTSAGGVAIAGPVTNSAVAVSNGLFTTLVDFGNAFNNSSNWLEIAVSTNGANDFTMLTPRQQITPTPYALVAESVNGPGLVIHQNVGDAPNVIEGSSVNFAGSNVVGATVGGGGAANYDGFPDTNSVTGDFATVSGGGNNAAKSQGATVGGGIGNTASSFDGTVGGGTGNTASGQSATVSGGGQNAASDDYATISGGSQNTAGYEATVSGGAGNAARGDWTTVSGGYQNTASDEAATVSGGYQNTASYEAATVSGGEYNTASNESATVSGGSQNTAIGQYATVSGGSQNTASYEFATVSGGVHNTASNYEATVSGGAGNTAGGQFSTVSGGDNNVANGDNSMVAGGSANYASADHSIVAGGSANDASADYSIVGGGANNLADAVYSIVGGGINNGAYGDYSVVAGGTNNSAGSPFASVGGGNGNSAAGLYATVAGGHANSADGDFSFAGGNHASAPYQGDFVWADDNGGAFSASANNQFFVRAGGGVYFYSGTGGTGVHLASGSGSWSSMSDRNAKENFQSVDAREILSAVAAMPLTTWNYKTQAKSIRHVGPMAQDFAAAFRVGENDTTISTVDEGGVALAAIQGLNQKLEAENAELKKQNDSLAERLNELEATVKAIIEKK